MMKHQLLLAGRLPIETLSAAAPALAHSTPVESTARPISLKPMGPLPLLGAPGRAPSYASLLMPRQGACRGTPTTPPKSQQTSSITSVGINSPGAPGPHDG